MRSSWRLTKAGVGAALVLVSGATLLSGCSPAPLPVIALRSVDGWPSLIVAPCDKFALHRISVFTAGSDPGPKWTVNRIGGAIPSEVRLFQVPPGWTVHAQSLTDLVPGIKYEISAYGRRKAKPILFEQGDVASLRSGEVLVGTSAGKAKVVKEAEFRKEARGACG